MNYRHSFHAGCFSDVIKHIILACFLEETQEKITPLTYLETHAGRALYHLKSSDTQKLQEYRFGIQALLNYAKTHPAPSCLQPYLQIVQENMDFSQYPGSPKIAEAFMREQDKMILCELHPEEFQLLKENMGTGDGRIGLHCADAYASMKAFLPPKTARGVVMIDPPFEKTNEFAMIEATLDLALKRWRMGRFLIWYPIKDKREVTKFQNTIFSSSVEGFCVDFFVENQEVTSNLMGCGMALINPPWKLRGLLEKEVLPYLAAALQGKWTINLCV